MILGAKHVHKRCPLVGKYSISSLEIVQHDSSPYSRNRKWTHDPTPVKNTSPRYNDCVSTFPADDNQTPILSQSGASLQSTDAKSYLMFGCAGESKFRLLNTCIQRRGDGISFRSDTGSHLGGSVISSPLLTSNDRNIYKDSSLSEDQWLKTPENGIIEGKCYYLILC